MKTTIRDLAKYIGKEEATLYYRKRTHPKEWALLWSGWVAYVEKIKETK